MAFRLILAAVLAALLGQTISADEPTAKQRIDAEGFPLPAEALARVGSARLRHGRILESVIYSPDGRILASLGSGLIRLWDAGTGMLLKSIPCGDENWTGAMFTADGKQIVILDRTICRWFDVGSWKEMRSVTLPVAGPEALGSFAPHGEALALADPWHTGKAITVYNLPSGKERFRKFGKEGWDFSPAISADGKMMAAVEECESPGPKRVIHLLDMIDGTDRGTIETGQECPELEFAPDGKHLLGQGHSLRLWSVPSCELVMEVPWERHDGTAAFTPDGKAIVLSGYPEMPFLDPATGEEIRRLHIPAPCEVRGFSPDGRTLAASTNNGGLLQLDVATGRRRSASLEPTFRYEIFQFDGDREQLWAVTTKLVRLDWRSGRALERLAVPADLSFRGLRLSPDRSRVAGVNHDKKLVVWDVASGVEIQTMPLAAEDTPGWAFGPDARTFYTVDRNGPVRGWDLATGRELSVPDQSKHLGHSLTVSPDGRWLAGIDHYPEARGSGFEARCAFILDMKSGRESYRFPLPFDRALLWDVAFSPDSCSLAVVGGDRSWPRSGNGSGFVQLWDLRSRKPRFTSLTPVPPTWCSNCSLAFSPDGRMLATSGDDLKVRLWEVASGRERHHFTGHVGEILSLAFSADGRLLASSSDDAPIFIWDVTGCYDQQPETTAFTHEEQDRLWNALADTNAVTAFQAMRQLLARPDPAAVLLRSRLSPTRRLDTKTLEQQLRALDVDDFVTRQQAVSELTRNVEQAEPLLRQALRNHPSPQVERQIEAVLAALESVSPERLQQIRAVEVLEWINTDQARTLLERLAGGAKEARLSVEARNALERLHQVANRHR